MMLTSSGKPIYTRWGDESALSGVMGAVQALLAQYSSMGGSLRHVRAGGHDLVFVDRGSIIMVCASRTGEPVWYLERQMEMMYDHMLFTLTSRFEDMLARNPSYDLRGLLGDAPGAFRSILSCAATTCDLVLDSVPVLRMPPDVRIKVAGSLQRAGAGADLLYAVAATPSELICTAQTRSPEHRLQHRDLLLLLNFLRSSRGLRGAESYIPLCMPALNRRATLHAYVAFPIPTLCLCFVTTTASPEVFRTLMRCKERAVADLLGAGTMDAVLAAQRSSAPSPDDLQMPGMLHFAYRSFSLGQYCGSAFHPLARDDAETKRCV